MDPFSIPDTGMDSEKERIAKWRAERRQRREEQRKASQQPYRSLFTIGNDELTDPRSCRNTWCGRTWRRAIAPAG